jgi:hypothetical protein
VNRSADDDVLAACASAIEAAHEAVVAPLRDEARRLVAEAGGDGDLVDVRVDRHPLRDRVSITLPPGLDATAEVVAVRLHDLYRRQAVASGRTIDFEISHPEEEGP